MSDVADYVLGGVIMASGALVALTNPVRSAVNKGECFDSACRDTVRPTAGATTAYALSGLATVALGAAVAWWIKPVARIGDRRPDSVQIGVEGRF